jgi:NAD(P)-dependent dehydrogenase (short-subunit alcohol dehydrogenase family)
MDRDFREKNVVVTGAASGIGAATATAFAAAGARVALLDIDGDALHTTAGALDGDGHVPLEVDVASAESVDAAFDRILAEFGSVDIAHNNAGVELPHDLLADVPEGVFDRGIAVNLKSFWLCMRRELTAMTAVGGGSIINTASVTSLVGVRSIGVYAAAKHGLLGLTKVAALEYADKGIRVNAVCPGAVRTGLLERRIAEHPQMEAVYAAKHPIGRIGEPEEIAEAVLWLAGDKSSFVLGHALVVDGGWTIE